MTQWTPDAVMAQAQAWVWVPPDALELRADDYHLIGFPAGHPEPTQVAWCRTDRPFEDVVAEVTGHARAWGRPAVAWWHRVNGRPADLGDRLVALGAEAVDVVDVMACDLTAGLPPVVAATAAALRSGTGPVTVRVVDGEEALLTALRIDAEVWGQDWMMHGTALAHEVAEHSGPVSGREAFRVVVFVDGEPASTGGCGRVGDVARLWGAGTRPALRGRGAYRAVLAARMALAHEHGATLALVRGRIETSAPILRACGFTPYGREVLYRLPL